MNEALWAANSGEDCEFPSMPLETKAMLVQPRRPKAADFPWYPFSALVARSVGMKEIATNKKALDAVLKEWDKLRKAGCWDESLVREWDDVCREAKAKGKKAHVGRIFEICVERGSELPESDPGRKFKGRVVFQGNDVKDENWDVALFQELSSSPATMEAGNAADAYGLFEGHTGTVRRRAGLYPIQAGR
jgi:hypothetical protein